MTKFTLSALALGAALAFAGTAQAEQSFSPLETGAGKARAGVASFVATGNGNAKAFVMSNGYTRALWADSPYRQISRR